MDTTKPLVNRVTAQKVLITLDLEDFLPKEEDIVSIDLKDFLFKGLILREADFRESVKTTRWADYQDKYVAIYCSTDAVIPVWAYMILSSELSPYAKDIAYSPREQAAEVFLYHNISRIDPEQYRNQRIVVKGCGDRKIPEAAFVQITQQLSKVARVVMYGEPCSTVPVFKKSID
jgi:hypothetical protein